MLVSAVLHAAWNVLLRRHPDAPAAVLLFMGGACAVALGASLAGPWTPALWWGVAAGASEGAYIFALGRAMRIGPLAAVYAVSRGLPLLLLWPLSHALLGEAVSLRAAAAVAVLLAGLLVLTPGRATTTREGYLWAALTAVFNCSNSLIYKAAIVRGAPVLPLIGLAFLIALPLAATGLAPWGRGFFTAASPRLVKAWKAVPGMPLPGALALLGSFALAVSALGAQGAAWVLTLRNMSIGLAPLLAWAALGERPSPRALAGVLLVFAGALSLGLA